MNTEIRFDEFEIDIGARELRRHGARVNLAPAPVQTLQYLAERSGHLVTRDELYTALWPEGDVDTQRLLNTYIRQIRTALGERGGDDRFIRTYPRRGYRFLRPTNLSADTASAHVTRRSYTAVLVLAVVAVVALVVVPNALKSVNAAAISGEVLPTNPQARIAYLTGIELLDTPLPQIRASAADHFREAVLLTPEFAPAFSGLAESLVWAGKPEDARVAANTALSLDSLDARAHLALGSTLLTVSWDWVAAEQHLRQARDIAPTEPAPGVALAFLLVSAGRNAEALEILSELVTLEPVSPVITGDIGMLYGWLGEHHTALELCQRTVRIEPRATWGHTCALDAARALGKADIVASESAAIVHAHGTDTSDVFSPSAGIDSRVAQLHRFQLSQIDDTSHFRAAMLWADMDMVHNALNELEQAANSREMGFVSISATPSFRSMHKEPRFHTLVQSLFETTTRNAASP